VVPEKRLWWWWWCGVLRYSAFKPQECQQIFASASDCRKTRRQTHLSEEVSHLELVLRVGEVGLDLGVRVVDDGEEHVEQDEEDEEHVENEVGRAEDAVRLLQSLEIEVAKDDAEQRETASK